MVKRGITGSDTTGFDRRKRHPTVVNQQAHTRRQRSHTNARARMKLSRPSSTVVLSTPKQQSHLRRESCYCINAGEKPAHCFPSGYFISHWGSWRPPTSGWVCACAGRGNKANCQQRSTPRRGALAKATRTRSLLLRGRVPLRVQNDAYDAGEGHLPKTAETRPPRPQPKRR